MTKPEYVLVLSQSKTLMTPTVAFLETLGWKIVVATKPSEVGPKWQYQEFKLMIVLDMDESVYLPLIKNIQSIHPGTWIWIAQDFSRKGVAPLFTDKVVYMEMGALDKNLKGFLELLTLSFGAQPTTVQSAKKTSLVYSLDDEAPIAHILDRFFLRQGYESRAFTEGPAMLEKLKTEKPDIIFLDYNMPVMSGVEVLKAIRSQYSKKDLPVVFISGAHDSDKIQGLLELGINDFVVKPFDEARLAEKVKKLLN